MTARGGRLAILAAAVGGIAAAAGCVHSEHTCYLPGWGSSRLSGTLSAVDSTGSAVSGSFVEDLVTGEMTGPIGISFEAGPGLPGEFDMFIGQGLSLVIRPLQSPAAYTLSPPQFCLRTCPPDHPLYVATMCEADGGQADAGMVSPSDCLQVDGVITITANAATGSASANVVSSSQPIFDKSLKFDLTIAAQPGIPLSGHFSLDYQVVSLAKESTSVGCD